MPVSLYRNIKRYILSLLIVTGYGLSLYSQSSISGVVNKYGRVTTVGTDYVVVSNETQFDQFAAGDTVLLIQMKGVRIYSYENGIFGTTESSYGPSGMHEFLMIESVDDLTNTIVFRNNIVNSTFNIEGQVQIIKVPSFNNALVTASLTAQPWDSISKTGGVLSVIVGNTLTLNANIDVSGKGFIGGSPVIGTGICVQTNELRYSKYAFHRDSLNSGFKGESPVTRGWLALGNYPLIYPAFAKGKGANFTGGGGGNGRFSGGGGGSNYGAGGKGGREVTACSPFPVDGGLGGYQIQTTLLEGGMFLGGGGGSSTYLTGSAASAGGNGGGIIIIVCDTIKGNTRGIIANGATAAAATGSNAGAGGGGGGGTIAIYLRSYSTSNLTVAANGGNGGNNPGTYGEGGGGGGGLITASNITTPTNVTKTVSGGAPGTRSGVVTAGSGSTGQNIATFVPILNGFLFNSIRSSVTGDQTDSI
ncbi:MAG: hypothetical protein IQL11_11510, partial [Bacteroidales bacterium]|nr:hypothetical protein [Bacteroidales bacterium]